jgi:hypothetical protein
MFFLFICACEPAKIVLDKISDSASSETIEFSDSKTSESNEVVSSDYLEDYKKEINEDDQEEDSWD